MYESRRINDVNSLINKMETILTMQNKDFEAILHGDIVSEWRMDGKIILEIIVAPQVRRVELRRKT